MSIRLKILACCLALTALTGLLGIYAQQAERELGALALRIYDDAFMGVSYLRSAQVGFASLLPHVRTGTMQNDNVSAVLGDLTVARDRAMSPEGRAAAEHLAAAVATMAAHPAAGTNGGAEIQEEFEGAVETFAADGFRYRRDVGDLVEAQIRRSSIVVGITVLGALGITVLLTQLIAPPVRRAVRVAQAIADGKLDNIISTAGHGETGELLRALSVMQSSIAKALAHIRALMDEQAASHAGELAAEHARLEAALDNMTQGLCLFAADRRLAVANRRFAEMFGQPLVGATAEAVLLRAGLGMLAEGTNRAAVVALSCDLPDGRSIAVSQRPVGGGGWVATYEDVSERKATEARLSHMARHDALTGLPNRLLFSEHMQRVLARARRDSGAALLYVDLDRFKSVNDTLGHAAGDIVLREATRRMRGCTRETDMVVRLGGDEFVVVQEQANQPADGTALARRLIETLSDPYDIDGQEVIIGASIGIAMTTDESGTADALLKCADLALYRAKSEGRGTFRFFEDAMDAAMQARRSLEFDLRRALAEGQFEVNYQPLVQEAGIAGFEALLRWHHPQRGTVSPAVFIPIAEEVGLIGAIGAWVLTRACTDAASWPGSLKVAVNLSPAQFRSRSLIDDTAAALSGSGLPGSRLELEITESVMLQDDDHTILKTLHSLRQLGIRIAMDDFGTGYSSLSYLRRFPFDKIKIDQSFVKGIETSEECRTIVRAVVGLGRSLGMAVNAEGVETSEQLDALRAEGCREIQGFWFSKPIAHGKVPELLERLGNSTLPATELQANAAGIATHAAILPVG